MADITDHHDQGSPSLDDHPNGGAAGEPRGTKRARPSTADDDDDDDDKPGRERRKIEIKFITDKSRRHITFSKRKAGIMKKVRRTNSQHRVHRVLRSQFQLLIGYIGIRVVSPHWYPSSSPGRLRDWVGVHLHDPQAPAIGYQS